MRTATLKENIQNTVLDVTITIAHAGAKVTILEDFGSYYEVAYFGGSAPSTTFYVNKGQVSLDE